MSARREERCAPRRQIDLQGATARSMAGAVEETSPLRGAAGPLVERDRQTSRPRIEAEDDQGRLGGGNVPAPERGRVRGRGGHTGARERAAAEARARVTEGD